jgi:cellulose synthase/poly-beta-1,6-N-acetylglucosamine synthase-like glycosyltransferase
VPFNGTCGVWRTQAIVDAGGWHDDTLTEDLDLSLRARLRGWRSAYLGDVGVPGMLPESPRAWRTQQFRWTKGFVECLIKLAPSIWRSQRLASWQKLLITLQLAQPLAFLIGGFSILAGLPFIAGALTPGLVLSSAALLTGSIGLLGPLSLLVIGARGAPPMQMIRESAIALLLTSGLMLSNARAALEAFVGIRSAFIRTPKRAEAQIPVSRFWLQRRGLIELSVGGGLLVFVLLQHPIALLPMMLVIGGLLAFGLMQLDEQSGAVVHAVTRGD